MKCKYPHCSNEIVNNSNTEKLYCSYKCKNKDAIDRHRWRYKIKAVMAKGGACIRCGYNKCVAALEFHHRIPEEKSFPISHPHTRSWDKLTEEVEKCDLLCANCHREEEFKRTSSHKGFIKELLTEFGSLTQM